MKNIKLPNFFLKLYEFDDLEQDAQNKAINEEIKFMIEFLPYEQLSDKAQKAVDKANEMRTPWFTGEYLWEYCEHEIKGNCRQFYYDITGEIIPVTYHMKNNEVEKTTVTIFGQETEIKLTPPVS